MENKINTAKILKDIFSENWGKEFLVDGINGKELTYGDFFGKAMNCKKKLEDLKFRKNDIICLLIYNSLEFLVLYFACLMAGLVCSPIDPKKGEGEIKEISAMMKYKALITNLNDFDFLPKKIKIEEFNNCFKKATANIKELSVFDELDYEKLFLITFTSGSTGAPKGVMHSFNNLFLSACAFKKKFDFGKESIFYHNLSMSYMAGILNLFILPLVSESKIVIGECFDVSNLTRFWNLPMKYSVNTFWFIPTIINILLKLDRGEEGINYARKNKIIGCVGTAPLNQVAKIEFEKKYRKAWRKKGGNMKTIEQIPYACPVCHGTGRVFPQGYTVDLLPFTCHSCKGSGIVYGTKTTEL